AQAEPERAPAVGLHVERHAGRRFLRTPGFHFQYARRERSRDLHAGRFDAPRAEQVERVLVPADQVVAYHHQAFPGFPYPVASGASRSGAILPAAVTLAMQQMVEEQAFIADRSRRADPRRLRQYRM